MVRIRFQPILGAALALALALALGCDPTAPGYAADDDADGDGEECVLDCWVSGDSLVVDMSCCSGSSSCSYTYDGYGRVSSMDCSCSGYTFDCDIHYDGLGQPSGSCDGEGDSCSF